MARVKLVTQAQALTNAAAVASARSLDAERAQWVRLEYLDKQANFWVVDA